MSADKPSTEWTSIDDCRKRVGELQSAYHTAFAELQQVTTDLVSATYALDLCRKRCLVLQRELESSERRGVALLDEVQRCKRGGTVTPIRPPRRP